MQRAVGLVLCFVFACGDSGGSNGGDDAPPGDGGGNGVDAPPPNGVSPEIGGCSILPPDHIFNTPIGDLPSMTSGNIRGEYTWPATHEASSNMSTGAPPMGQLFRIKDSFVIPASWSTQSKAIAQAMKTYGMYVADGGSNWYVTGAPGAWDDSVFDQIQSIEGSNFEAVDLRPIIQRAGFDPTSARVPPP